MMFLSTASGGTLKKIGHASVRWFVDWWHVIWFGAVILVLVLSPSSYRRDSRRAIARNIYLDTVPILVWFTVLSALISLVLIRIVVVTALSYGLSQYALAMVVRVLVLELLPLTAAVFATLHCTVPNGTEIAALRASGEFDALTRRGVDPLHHEVLPRAVSGVFCLLMLVAVSGVVTLVLAYLSDYGFTTEALAGYTRTVGRVFSPSVALIFVIKSLFFGIAVALIPLASILNEQPRARSRAVAELRALVRTFLALLLIEALSLIGNYY